MASASSAFEAGDYVVWSALGLRPEFGLDKAHGEGPHLVETVRAVPEGTDCVGHPQWVEVRGGGLLSGALVERWPIPRLTTAQKQVLLHAAKDARGIAECWSTNGLTRSTWARMMERLRAQGLFDAYPHGRAAYEITALGRYVARELHRAR